MIKRLQKVISVTVASFFATSSILCCCLASKAQASQPAMAKMPACHMHAKQGKQTPVGHKDCNCLLTKKLIADSNLKNFITPSFSHQPLIVFSHISTDASIFNTVAIVNTGPPFLKGKPLALYIRHSNLRI